MDKVGAVIMAAGRSSRMQGADKLDLPLSGGTVLSVSAERFLWDDSISEVVIAVRPEELERRRREFAHSARNKPLTVVPGGETRFLSVQNGVAALSGDVGYVAIHDAARPFVRPELTARVIAAAKRYGAAAPGVALADTVKEVDEPGFVTATLRRGALRAVATPQVFSLALYKAAAAVYPSCDALDDCEVVERYGHPVFVTEGDRDNIKITTREDIKRLSPDAAAETRVGHGYDVHRFETGRNLILGGVKIPFEQGLLGHSDADVLVHAVMDALLGAAALGDIGALFPDTDRRFAGADSLLLLAEVGNMLRRTGCSAVNIDATVVCQRPKLAPYREEMRKNIASALGLDATRVGVKATTEEGLGFTGEMRGISAHAVASVRVPVRRDEEPPGVL